MKKSILVVDDTKDAREALADIASAPDRNVMQAENLDNALELIRENDFQVVITDLRLDGKGSAEEKGLDVLKAALDRDLHTQVIVVTDFPNDTSVVKAMTLGAFDYLDRTSLAVYYRYILPQKIKLAFSYSDMLAKQQV
jgi:DNA-binding NtrC family response regulator